MRARIWWTLACGFCRVEDWCARRKWDCLTRWGHYQPPVFAEVSSDG